ncbi:hypothetical protein ES705_14610 [subsurface metagenome]
MCWFKKKKEKTPDWIQHPREEVAQAEEEAASTHYTLMQLIEDGWQPGGAYGDWEFNNYWYQMHLEAAWYIRNPKRVD